MFILLPDFEKKNRWVSAPGNKSGNIEDKFDFMLSRKRCTAVNEKMSVKASKRKINFNRFLIYEYSDSRSALVNFCELLICTLLMPKFDLFSLKVYNFTLVKNIFKILRWI